MSGTIHIQPTAPLAERVLVPGDPGRALLLAQALLSEPKMFNHNRGLWGYTGPALLDGEPLTIQSTGMGGPSAAIVIAELADLGARTIVRVGTCGVRAGPVVSADLFYDTAPGTEERWRDDGLLGVEMETATLFALAARRRLRAGAGLIVTDLLFPSRRRIDPDGLRDAEH